MINKTMQELIVSVTFNIYTYFLQWYNYAMLAFMSPMRLSITANTIVIGKYTLGDQILLWQGRWRRGMFGVCVDLYVWIHSIIDNRKPTLVLGLTTTGRR